MPPQAPYPIPAATSPIVTTSVTEPEKVPVAVSQPESDTPNPKPRTTVRLTEVFKPSAKPVAEIQVEEVNQPYTPEALLQAWNAFADTRKHLHAEYQLLTSGYEQVGDQIRLTLTNPIQEMMLDGVKVELVTSLRKALKNNNLQVTGVLQVSDDKRVLYTSREKFEYLLSVNPALRELKDRLGLDTDY